MAHWIESEFHTFDGLTLFYRYKKPNIDTQNTLLLLHRGHEHSGRVTDIADKLSADQHWCFSFDLRGHGRSEGTRAWAPNFETWIRDLNSFAGHLHQQHNIKTSDILLIANSVGSVMAVSWILNYGPSLKGCILGAPAFKIKLYIPLALQSLRLLSKVSDHQFVTSYVKSSLLTRDPQQALAYDNDPLITKKIGVNILVTLFDTTKNCFNRLADFETPVLIITAENDVIVQNKQHTVFYNGISSTIKKHITLKNFKHAIFHEQDPHLLIAPCQQFIQQQFNHHTANLPAIIPAARLHTVAEYQSLQQADTGLKKVYHTAARWCLSHIGKYANGIATGLKYGFDSGVALDYVYNNTPAGSNWLGKQIDKAYLQSVGWRGIRTRKQHLKHTLSNLIDNMHANGVTPIIFDIASGPGRYLFELQQEKTFPLQLYLNDIDSASLDKAKQISAETSYNASRFFNQDIFNPSIDWHFDSPPNIIIVSGLFELYDNNQQAHPVINHLFSLLQAGGYLIYTGQPWHPQLKLIGRLLNNRQGERWIMRRRPQIEIDQLIAASGFTKMSTIADDKGIFTVSFAQKLGA